MRYWIFLSILLASVTCWGDRLYLGDGKNSSPVEENSLKCYKIPASNTCMSAIEEGRLCWDDTNNLLYVGTGTGARAVLGDYVMIAKYDNVAILCVSIPKESKDE